MVFVDWDRKNYCTGCGKTCPKQFLFCPICHIRVRTVPHKVKGKDMRLAQKNIAREVRQIYVLAGGKQPRKSYSAARWL